MTIFAKDKENQFKLHILKGLIVPQNRVSIEKFDCFPKICQSISLQMHYLLKLEIDEKIKPKRLLGASICE
jgi:hypothetical protein